jgi:hypothetical protein
MLLPLALCENEKLACAVPEKPFRVSDDKILRSNSRPRSTPTKTVSDDLSPFFCPYGGSTQKKFGLDLRLKFNIYELKIYFWAAILKFKFTVVLESENINLRAEIAPKSTHVDMSSLCHLYQIRYRLVIAEKLVQNLLYSLRSYFQFSSTTGSCGVWRICLRICRVSGRASYIWLYLASYLRPVWLYLPPNLELTNVTYFTDPGRAKPRGTCILPVCAKRYTVAITVFVFALHWR